MMIEVNKDVWLLHLRNGDFGLTQGHSLFSKFQNWLRKVGQEGPRRASHAFYQKVGLHISEADGWRVTGKNEITRYLTKKHRIWMFRYAGLTRRQLDIMNAVTTSAERAGGTYSWGGIREFAKYFVRLLLPGRERKRRWLENTGMKDRRGVFCSEYTSMAAKVADLAYITEREEWEISPSYQLNWFFDEAIKSTPWQHVLAYDRGRFYADERLILQSSESKS